MNFKQYLQSRQRLVEEALQRWVPKEDTFPPEVHKAMRYSLFAGGKRLRPILALAAAEAVGGSREDVLPLACALELIHTYSLIHDDLPAMDNDDLRRGKPTSHKMFGEALAILTGDALLTEAFFLLARPDLMKRVPPRRRLRAIREVARAAGSLGMVGGQTMDILCQGKEVGKELLEYIHTHKTGALIAAAVSGGAIIGGASSREYKALSKYGEKLGLAFQIIDDLLDIQGNVNQMGKAVHKDNILKKVTYPAFFGFQESKRLAQSLIAEAILYLQIFDKRADPLRELAKYILKRSN